MATELAVNGRFSTQRLTGVQRYALEITRRLHAHPGVSGVTVVAPRRPTAGPPLRAARTSLVRHGVLGGHAWEQLELPAATRRAGVLWSPCNVGPVAARRHVVTIHDLFSILRPAWVGRRFHLWYRTLLPVLARRCSHVIVVSEHTRRQVQDVLGVEDARVTVVPEGVDDAFAPSDARSYARLRATLGLPPRFVLALGSLEPRKNLERLVEAWARLPGPTRLPLAIAGGVGDPRVFGRTALADRLTRKDIHLLGYVPDADLPTLYGAAAVFVYPSEEEGFGLPPLEAIACGTPTITSNTSAMAENCRDIAVLVDPLDVDQLSAAIARLCETPPAPSELEAARVQVRERFDWSDSTRRVADILVDHAAT